MVTHLPEEVTLDKIMAVRGVGSTIMGTLPLPDRVRLRGTCRAFLAAADESLQGVTELFGDDIVGGVSRPGASGLPWLVTKCSSASLVSLCVALRCDHDKAWIERDRFALATQSFEGIYYYAPGALPPLEDIAAKFQGLAYVNVAGCDEDVTNEGIMALARACRHNLTSLDVSFCTQVKDEGVTAVAENCTRLVKLALHGCKRVTDATMPSVARHCGGTLEELDVGRTKVRDVGLVMCVRGCTRLRALTLAHFFTDISVCQVAAFCGKLERLSVWGCQGVTDAGILAIAARCPSLQWLDATFCQVSDKSVCALARGCPGLRHLKLVATGVTDAGIKVVADVCGTSLELLDVSSCEGVTDAGITRVARKCGRLRQLAVDGCGDVTDASISEVAERCHGIEELFLSNSGIEGEGVRAIAAHARELRCLEVACGGLTVEDVVAIAQGCPNLEELDVSQSADCGTKEAINAIVCHCTKLRAFKAEGCGLDDDEVALLITERGRQLRVLDVSRGLFLRISDKTLALVASHCPQLEKIALRGCRVTNDGVRLLASGCKNLRHLDVKSCVRVTQASLDLFEGWCEVEAYEEY
eukprot:jgi/Mesvir1/17195/Mv07615-RA.1